MRDEHKKEWQQLVTITHIDLATRHLKRLSQSLHVAFMIKFMSTLTAEDVKQVQKCLVEGVVDVRLDTMFQEFMETSSEKNATFAMHRDWMLHCDEVVALYIAERMGGYDGYQLLLSTVKQSLVFQFVNGACSYGPLCTQLIYEYYTCGAFHQGMKHTMYSTPFGKSSNNFATDTKREMDHTKAGKMLRAGSIEAAILR